MANRLNWLRNRSTGCARPVEDRSRDAKKFLSPSGFSSRSRSGRGPVEVRSKQRPLEPESKCKKIGSLVEASSYGTLTRLGGSPTLSMVLKLWKNLQGIREGDEDIEVSPIKVAYQGHRNSRSKRLTKLPMEELIGSLMTYEINLTKKLQEGEDKKKKSIALKATTKEEEDVEEENQVMKMMI
ncbi:hypothetical protein CK203_113621 [Vitis vinifera]|uniref:Uncharacterized protein n=1 Tax=Vitis vinifera TaxID=29760 RepID=A0A438FEE1_VITVI|nr:hypothetical protein CK203_113621 [Vitis vinifera]